MNSGRPIVPSCIAVGLCLAMSAAAFPQTIVLEFHPGEITCVVCDDEGNDDELEIYHTWQMVETTSTGSVVEDKQLVRYAAQGVGGGQTPTALDISEGETVPFTLGKARGYTFQGRTRVHPPLAGHKGAAIFDLQIHWWEKDRGGNVKDVKGVFTNNELLSQALSLGGSKASTSAAAEAVVALLGLTGVGLSGAAEAVVKDAIDFVGGLSPFDDEYLGTTKLFVEVDTDGDAVKWQFYRYGEKKDDWKIANSGYNWQPADFEVNYDKGKTKLEGEYQLSVSVSGITN